MQISKTLIALWALLAAPSAGLAGQPTMQRQVTAIVGATVLPMEGPERLANHTVIIRGDRIDQVGPSDRVKVPAGARIIDGRGQVLMPGLVDMHVHLTPAAGNPGDPAQRALAVMLAHGVTTARGMAGSPANLEVRGKIEARQIAGPRLYAAAPALHDKNTPTAEQGRQAVRQAKAAGFDLIKSHELSDVGIWQAVADEAAKAGIPTGGHVNHAIGLGRVLAARQQVEHLDGVIAELVKMAAPGESVAFGQMPPPPAVAAASRVTDAQLALLARKVAAAKSWHVPTLSLFEKIVDVSTPVETLMTHPDMRYLPKAALQQWAGQHGQMKQIGYSAADAAAFVQLRRRIVRAFAEAGVPIMAGSDTAQAFHIWGPGLHEEVRALTAAGLSPMDALRAATVVPRNYFRSLPNGGSALGWKADFGAVTPGARADLILLSSDPSRDLSALTRPKLVIAGGRVFERATLDAMLAKVIADANAAPAIASAGSAVYVIRHLQKGTGEDPPLTPAGAANAQRLAQMLGVKGIKAVFATPTRRAQETAAPLARSFGLPVTQYNPADMAALQQQAAAAGGPVLIVGHSNTVPEIVAAFGGAKPGPIADDEFGTIYLVEPGSKQVRQISVMAGERG